MSVDLVRDDAGSPFFPDQVRKFLIWEGFKTAFYVAEVKMRVLICLEAPSMELQERFALGTAWGTAVRSRRMLRMVLPNESREEVAILASRHRCD